MSGGCRCNVKRLKYCITNVHHHEIHNPKQSEHNAGLRLRGSLTFWFTWTRKIEFHGIAHGFIRPLARDMLTLFDPFVSGHNHYFVVI